MIFLVEKEKVKAKNILKFEQYRLINTLKTCDDFMEKVVKDQLGGYMEKHRLLSKFQSGHRKKYSFETAVNCKINKLKC